MNIRNTTAKERMLKKIRQALLQKRENPYADFEDSPLYKDEAEPLDVTFARELVRASGNFVYCDGEISVVENLILLAEELKLKKMYAWEPGIQQLLAAYGFPVYTNPHQFETAEVGITACEALIARNGSVLLANAEAAGRRLSAYPPIHIVIGKASQLVMDFKHGFKKLQDKFGQEMPSMLTAVTGPSSTAEIESKLVSGGVGTKQLYVFLVEDRF